MTLTETFDGVCAKLGQRIAVIEKDRTTSFAELRNLSLRIAHRLNNVNIKPGDRVGIDIKNGRCLYAAIIGVLRAGGVYVPIDRKYPLVASLKYLKLVDTKYLLSDTSDRFLSCIENVEVSDLDAATGPIFEAKTNIPQPNAPAYIMFTSGTTGPPKAVRVRESGIIRLVKNTNYVKLNPSDVVLQMAPISFDASTFEIWSFLLNGASVVPYQEPVFDLVSLEESLLKGPVTILWLPASVMHLVARTIPEALRNVRVLITGGDVLNAQMVRKLMDSNPKLEIINGYGPTENTTFTCCFSVKPGQQIHSNIPIGWPVSATSVYIVDDNLKPVDTGKVGEIVTGGAGLSDGYINDADLTAIKFVQLPHTGERVYRTGDLGRLNGNGEVEFLGRNDDQVKINGYRIELPEVRRYILSIDGVEDCAIVLCEKAGRKALECYVKTYKRLAIEEIRANLAKQAPRHYLPEKIIIVDELPMNINGKINKRDLIKHESIS